jgi:hypothetical protein
LQERLPRQNIAFLLFSQFGLFNGLIGAIDISASQERTGPAAEQIDGVEIGQTKSFPAWRNLQAPQYPVNAATSVGEQLVTMTNLLRPDNLGSARITDPALQIFHG